MAEMKLRDQVRDIARLRHLSPRTEEAYWNWIKRFILFHKKRHPREMGSEEITTFLTYLAVQGRVAASTQNQAFNALLFLYRQVLKLDMPDIKDIVRARQKRRLPVVLTHEEVYLPYALDRKYKNAAREFGWQYVFPDSKLSNDPQSGKRRRHHVLKQNVQRAVKKAVRDAGVNKNATGLISYWHIAKELSLFEFSPFPQGTDQGRECS